MALKKTCWLVAIYPCRVGVLLGLRRYARHEPYRSALQRVRFYCDSILRDAL